MLCEENLVTTGMLEGKCSKGKQREKLIEGMTDWLKAGKSLEAIEATKDRKKWRIMIANALFMMQFIKSGSSFQVEASSLLCNGSASSNKLAASSRSNAR
ncbi:hypothetical protein PoB_001782100 [Plakobranchus ocellatus]|uniref:Uncharacterized protein n=1 Tax=Plakobranchus ocellatus TaxID=259542 RepID=A0AAV3Z9I5_9GAST|nr:hypothetical protein PoB_001782100 [Plakobranchus ocellatus]